LSKLKWQNRSLEESDVEYLERLNNIYVIDGMMWGFRHYMSSYLVQGDNELVLVDTAETKRLNDLRAGINAHGFAVSDISKVFITHAHLDHAGNVAPILREAPNSKVYAHPLEKQRLEDP
jgi:glyoxylase-like metal-dependent hydrolase (beta-lactamase superfamily II)